MNDQQFQKKLEQHPCPNCHTAGFLEARQTEVRARYKGKDVSATGEMVKCHSCGWNFMEDSMTQSIATQIGKIDGRPKHIEVARGKVTCYALN